VHIVVQTPTHLSKRQEELLREFATLDGKAPQEEAPQEEIPHAKKRSSWLKRTMDKVSRFFCTLTVLLFPPAEAARDAKQGAHT
jgi:DnaJ-class molecular chaperone